MSTPSLKQTIQKVKSLKLNVWLGYHLQKQELNKGKLSRLIGMSSGYLQKQEKKGDFSGAQLVTLGNYLDTNPFEPYFPLLNHLARPTQTERALEQTITELQARILTLEQERDLLKAIVMK